MSAPRLLAAVLLTGVLTGALSGCEDGEGLRDEGPSSGAGQVRPPHWADGPHPSAPSGNS
ncbi:hypothetical protein [Streptomyces sp. NPDC000983]|uniref:hypothetical protein n=1 Tax=Streptomyces sp. NPDC000983 TaxID=3154373 RepID=UPI0033338518